MREVRIEPLTQASFAPFGQTPGLGLHAGISANQGSALRFDWAARLETTRSTASPNLSVFESKARALPFEVRLLERHPCSTQVFLPLRCASWVVIVAPALSDGAPDLSCLRAFRAEAGSGICYARNTWHHPLVALAEDARFAMLAWEDGTALDCVETRLAQPLLVVG